MSDIYSFERKKGRSSHSRVPCTEVLSVAGFSASLPVSWEGKVYSWVIPSPCITHDVEIPATYERCPTVKRVMCSLRNTTLCGGIRRLFTVGFHHRTERELSTMCNIPTIGRRELATLCPPLTHGSRENTVEHILLLPMGAGRTLLYTHLSHPWEQGGHCCTHLSSHPMGAGGLCATVSLSPMGAGGLCASLYTVTYIREDYAHRCTPLHTR